MAEGETAQLTTYGDWYGQPGVITVDPGGNITPYDAAAYVYGLFRAEYTVEQDGSITGADPEITGGWGDGIQWNSANGNWELA